MLSFRNELAYPYLRGDDEKETRERRERERHERKRGERKTRKNRPIARRKFRVHVEAQLGFSFFHHRSQFRLAMSAVVTF